MRFLVLTALLVLSGCGLPTSNDWKQVRFQVTGLEFHGLRENQAEWRVVVAAHNPTGKRLRLEGLHLFARMGTDSLGALRTARPVDLAPGDTTSLSLELVMAPAAWNRALQNLRRTGMGELIISGDAYVDTWFGVRKVPGAVHKTYEIDLASLLGGMGNELLRELFRRREP